MANLTPQVVVEVSDLGHRHSRHLKKPFRARLLLIFLPFSM